VKWVPHTHANPKHAKFCFICLHGKLEGQNDNGVEAEVKRQKADETDLPPPAELRDLGYLTGAGGPGVFRRAPADFEKNNLTAVWLRSIQDRVYDASIQNMVSDHNFQIINGADVGLVDAREDDQDRDVLDKLFTMSKEEVAAVDDKLSNLGAWCVSQEERLVDVMPPPRPREELPKVDPPTQEQLMLLEYQPLVDPSHFKGDSAAGARDAMRSADAAIGGAAAGPGTREFKGFRVEDLPRPETAPDMPDVEVLPYDLGPKDLPAYEPLQAQPPDRRPVEALTDPFQRPALYLPVFRENQMPEFSGSAGFGEPRPSAPAPAEEEWLSTTRSIFPDNNIEDEQWGWGLVPARARMVPPLVDEPYLPPSSTGLVDREGGGKVLIARSIWDPELWLQGGTMCPPLRDRGRALYAAPEYVHPDEPRWSAALAPIKGRDAKIRDTVTIVPVKSYARFKPKKVSVDLPDFLWELARQDAAGQGIWDVIEQRHDIPREQIRKREDLDRATQLRMQMDQEAIDRTVAEEESAYEGAEETQDPFAFVPQGRQPPVQEEPEMASPGGVAEEATAPVVAEQTQGLPAMEVEVPEAPAPGPPRAAVTAQVQSSVQAATHHTHGATTGNIGAQRAAPVAEARGPMLQSGAVSSQFGSRMSMLEDHATRTTDLISRHGGESRKVEEILADDRFMDTLADKISMRLGGSTGMAVSMPMSFHNTGMGGGTSHHAEMGHGVGAFGAGKIMRPDPPSFVEPQDEHSQAQLPRALLEGAQTNESKLPRNMGPTTSLDINHFTQEKMRGDCYVRLLVHPEANAARKDIVPYEGTRMDPDPTLVTGKERPNVVVPPKGQQDIEDMDDEDEDEFADFERTHTVIFSFVRHNRFEAVEALIQQEAGILRARDENLNNLLHVACQNNNRRIAKLLIANGISVNEKNGKGNTPLHYCSQYHFMQLADYLIAHGADDAIPNNAGLLPCQGLGRTEDDISKAQRGLRADQVGGPG
jgi:hypothetical protein